MTFTIVKTALQVIRKPRGLTGKDNRAPRGQEIAVRIRTWFKRKAARKKKQKKTLKIAKDVDLYDGYLFYRNATCLNNLMKIKLLLETT